MRRKLTQTIKKQRKTTYLISIKRQKMVVLKLNHKKNKKKTRSLNKK